MLDTSWNIRGAALTRDKIRVRLSDHERRLKAIHHPVSGMLAKKFTMLETREADKILHKLINFYRELLGEDE